MLVLLHMLLLVSVKELVFDTLAVANAEAVEVAVFVISALLLELLVCDSEFVTSNDCVFEECVTAEGAMEGCMLEVFGNVGSVLLVVAAAVGVAVVLFERVLIRVTLAVTVVVRAAVIDPEDVRVDAAGIAVFNYTILGRIPKTQHRL